MKLQDSSPWLSAKNCMSGEKVTLLDEGQWKESTKFTYDDGNPVRQLVFKVRHNNEEKQLSMIKPSKTALIEAYGDDTIEWVGKECIIQLALNTKGGKSIVLEPCTRLEKQPEEEIINKEFNEAEPEGVHEGQIGEEETGYKDKAI